MGISAINHYTSNSNMSYQQGISRLSAADKAKWEAAAQKAGVTIQPGQQPSNADIEEIKEAGGLDKNLSIYKSSYTL